MTTPPSMKVCNKCDCILAIESFNRDKRTADGKARTCRKCVSDYRRQRYIDLNEPRGWPVRAYGCEPGVVKEKRRANRKRLRAAERRSAKARLADWVVRAKLINGNKVLKGVEIPKELIRLKRMQLQVLKHLRSIEDEKR